VAVRLSLPIVCAFALSCASSVGLPAWAPAQTPEPDSVAVNEDYGQSQPDVAFSGGLGVMVWVGPEWSYCTDRGRHWSAPSMFPTIAISDQPGYRPRVCSDRNGMFYAVDLYDASAIAVYRIRQDEAWISTPSLAISTPFDGSNYYDSPRIVCDPTGAMVCASCTYGIKSGLSAIGTIEVVRSGDGGVTWSAPVVVGGSSSNGSSIAVGPEGEVAVSWEDFPTGTVQVAVSRDSGATFSAPVTAAPILDDLGMPPPGWSDISLRYAPGYVTPEVDADFPSLAIDTSAGPHRGAMYLTWADYRDGSLGPNTGVIFEGEPNDYFAQARPVQVGQDVYGTSYSYEFAGGDDCDYFYFDGVAGEPGGETDATTFADNTAWVLTHLGEDHALLAWCR
jgi:hypothetical protein